MFSGWRASFCIVPGSFRFPLHSSRAVLTQGSLVWILSLYNNLSASTKKQVENLFRYGLEAYSDIRDMQSSFVDTQLSPSGDMHDIYASYIEKSDEGYNFWVALSGDEVVGCVGCVPHCRDSLELQRLSVAESHRHFGLGKKLLGKMEKWGKERPFSRIMLSTLREMNLQ